MLKYGSGSLFAGRGRMQPNKLKIPNPDENFSKTLAEMRAIAVAMVNNKHLSLAYDEKEDTSSFNPETMKLTLSLKPYPIFVKTSELLAKKVLDGDMGHELGHLVLTKPIWNDYNNWVTRIKRTKGYFKLAHDLVNVVEDKRVNHYIIMRYKYDIGKRLLLANLIIKDMIDNNMEGSSPRFKVEKGLPQGAYMMAILINQGLYEGKCTGLWAQLSDVKTKNEKGELTSSPKEDMKQALTLLERSKYQRIRTDILRTADQIHQLIAKNLNADYTQRQYVVSRRLGNVYGELSDKMKQELKDQVEKELKELEEKEKNEHLKDLQKGSGAGEGTGLEIPAPTPNPAEYQRLIDECKQEINDLLDLLKKRLRPITERRIFQKRGRLMSPLIPKIYTNSFRGVVHNVYTNVSTTFEKEQVAIAFLFDYSGSVDREQAKKITTILNEVFGHYVDDGGFSIGCFGADSQKVKTFFETFETTRMRVGGIDVNGGGTEVSVLLESNLKMFNAIRNRRKICVIASDFWFGDESRAEELIRIYEKAGIELLFIGFCGCDRMRTFAQNVKARRTAIKEVSELPQRFLEVYLNVQT